MATKLDVKAMAAVVSALQWIYERAIDGVPGLEGAPDLAAAYQRHCASDEDAIDALVRWQVAKAAAAGFLTNLGGIATLPIALPANVLSALYIQIRMVAAIAALRGHDLKSDQVRTVVLACLCGTTLLDVVKEAGIGVGAGIAQQAVSSLSTEALRRLARIGALRRVGSTSRVVRLTPLVGGVVAGALDGALTRAYANAAKKLFITIGSN
ncbi:MAG TPA: EcsC family protein [Stellaceae bacterium]|nr:EcsC family protein [Stellaceae bacterium]